jgi:hypothetical protein
MEFPVWVNTNAKVQLYAEAEAFQASEKILSLEIATRTFVETKKCEF